jgi:hypothetical protein
VVVVGAGLAISPAVAVAAGLVFGAVVAALSWIGSDLTPEGITVRSLKGTRTLAWGEVEGFVVIDDWNFGQRLAVVSAGERVVLPAPTGRTGGLAAAVDRVRRELARRTG